jgi:hypothetical protein
MSAGTLYKPARNSLAKTAKYLRDAVFDVAGLGEEVRRVLLSEQYTRARGPGGVDTYVRSTLIGPESGLAAPGSEYPHYSWTAGIRNVDFD